MNDTSRLRLALVLALVLSALVATELHAGNPRRALCDFALGLVAVAACVRTPRSQR